MKLFELDISDYRKGDELDPRSPYYEEPPEQDRSFQEEFVIHTGWPDANGDDEEMSIFVRASGEFVKDSTARNRDQIAFHNVTPLEVKVRGQRLSAKDFVQKYQASLPGIADAFSSSTEFEQSFGDELERHLRKEYNLRW